MMREIIKIEHDSGLLSNASVTMRDLLQFHTTTHDNIADVVWVKSGKWNKAGVENPFNLYFKPADDTECNIVTPPNVGFELLSASKLNCELTKPFRDIYFRLSDEVVAREKFFMEKYQIDPANTVAVVYRGTDKFTETPSIHPDNYLRELVLSVPNIRAHRVLIQTDQTQMLNYIKQIFDVSGVQSFSIEEMPHTLSNSPIHNVVTDRYELGINYLAVVSLLSKLKYVVMDTVNVAIWVGILKGSFNNTCRMYAEIKAEKH
jgi:hypothetical protein